MRIADWTSLVANVRNVATELENLAARGQVARPPARLARLAVRLAAALAGRLKT